MTLLREKTIVMLRRNIRLIVLCILSLAFLFLPGCSKQQEVVIGISMPTKTSERWLLDAKYTVNELEKQGYTPKIAFAEDVVGNQAAQIHNFIDEGVDLLIIAPIDSSPLSEVLQRAKVENIPIIAYDRLIMDIEGIDYYVSFDNFQVGVLQGEYLINHLDFKTGPKFIELFAGSSDDNNAQLFFEGAMSILRPYIESGDLIVKSQQFDIKEVYTLRWDKMIAKSRMTSLLNLYYQDTKIDGILAPYDGISRGVIEALEENGYKNNELPVITGQDAETTSIKSIIEGKQGMTVFKDVRSLALAAANIATSIIEEKVVELDPTLNHKETTLNNGINDVPSFFLQPIGVDAANWETVLVESKYYTKEEIIE